MKLNFKGRDQYMLKNCSPHFWGNNDSTAQIMAGEYDIFSFDSMTYEQAKFALKNKWIDPEEQQNSSPTVKAIMNFLKANPSFVAHGYVIQPKRDDTRISFEGVIATTKPSHQEFLNYVKLFHDADEFEAEYPYRAWYD